MRIKIYITIVILFLLKLILLPSPSLFAQMSFKPENEAKQIFSDKFNAGSSLYEDEEFYRDTAFMYKGWSFGLNFGFYFANRNTANFYNGSGTNDIAYILDNKYYKERIEQEIGYSFDTIYPPWDLPQNMRYDPAMAIGIFAKYYFNKNFALFFQTNYVKLKTSDIFILNLLLPQDISLDPTYNQYGIMGMEERFNLDIGVSQQYDLNNIVKLYFEAGVTMNNTKVIKNMIQIESMEYSIINVYGNQPYVPNSSLQEYEIRQGGIGWGLVFGTGIRLVFNEHVSIDPGFTVYLQNIVFKDNTNFKPTYSRFGPSYSVYIRFSFRDFF